MQENEPVQQLVIAAPLLPDKQEAYVRFVQELFGRRRAAYEASRHDLGVTREQFWLLETPGRPVAVITLTIQEMVPVEALSALLNGRRPFSRWLQRQLLELHGVDVREALFKKESFLKGEGQRQERGQPQDLAWLAELIAEWTASHDGRRPCAASASTTSETGASSSTGAR